MKQFLLSIALFNLWIALIIVSKEIAFFIGCFCVGWTIAAISKYFSR